MSIKTLADAPFIPKTTFGFELRHVVVFTQETNSRSCNTYNASHLNRQATVFKLQTQKTGLRERDRILFEATKKPSAAAKEETPNGKGMCFCNNYFILSSTKPNKQNTILAL